MSQGVSTFTGSDFARTLQPASAAIGSAFATVFAVTITAMRSEAIAAPPTPAPPTPTLTGTGLACRRGDRLLFTGLDITVRAGQIIWLRGSNGRGKTSLLRLLAGLSPPEAGSLRWGVAALQTTRGAHHASLAYVAHGNALKDDLNSTEALGFLASLHRQGASTEALHAALQQLGMHSRRNAPVRTLSQGQRRRVALARLALLPTKPLWLLDEPYDALDDEGCTVVDGLLTAHALAGGSVVLTSHLPLHFKQPAPQSLWLDGSAA